MSAVVGVEPWAFHWKFLEYGTERMAARPVWRPVAEEMRADHQQRLGAALEKTLTILEREAR